MNNESQSNPGFDFDTIKNWLRTLQDKINNLYADVKLKELGSKEQDAQLLAQFACAAVPQYELDTPVDEIARKAFDEAEAMLKEFKRRTEGK